jgi:hypothetical protein
MKKLRILLIFITLFVIKTSFTSAQVSLNVNINTQPLWGPVAYDHVEYYYLPEYDLYYYAPKAQFIHLKGNKWIFSNSVPYQYRTINLYSTYKVVINESKPYLRHDYYKNEYKHFKNEHSKQDVIRDSHDAKYTMRKGHPNNTQKKAFAPQNNTNRHSTNKPENKSPSKKKDKKQGKQ